MHIGVKHFCRIGSPVCCVIKWKCIQTQQRRLSVVMLHKMVFLKIICVENIAADFLIERFLQSWWLVIHVCFLCVQEGDSTMRNPSFPLRSPQSGCSPAGSEGTPKRMYTKDGHLPGLPFFFYFGKRSFMLCYSLLIIWLYLKRLRS